MKRTQYSFLPVFVLFISLTFICHAASDSNELKSKAADFYLNGKYDEALQLWYGMAKTGITDPNLYFNIGNAESMSGHIPEAILAYEKALRIRPANPHIKEAIKKERNKIENAVIPINSFFLIEWYRNAISLFRPGIWVLIGLLLLCFAVFLWLSGLNGIRLLFTKRKFIWLFSATGILCVLAGYLAYHQLHRDDEAVIMKACDIRQAPAEESPLVKNISPGEKVRITDQIAGWNKVSLLNLDDGWVKHDCLKAVNEEY